MKVTILKKRLSQALSIASRAISNQADLAILSNLMLRADQTNLYISATDLEIGVTLKVRGKIDEAGEITVPAQILSEFVSNSTSEKISLESEEDNLTLKDDKTQAQVKGQPSDEFPQIPDIEEEKTEVFEIASDKLLQGFNRVLISPAKDDSRPALSGVLFKSSDDELNLVGTDSYRLSEQKIALEKEVSFDQFIVPLKACQELTRVLEKEVASKVQVLVSENQIGFKTEDTTLVSRLIEGSYPDYKQIIPESYQTKIVVKRKELLNAAKTAWLFSRDQANNITVKVNPGEELKLEAVSPQVGKSSSEIDLVSSQGQSLEISFNVKFLTEVLSVLSDDNVKLGFNDAVQPAQLKGSQTDSYLYIIMPLKND